MRAVLGFMLAGALGLAACGSGGSHHAVPTTNGARSRTGEAPTTTVRLAGGALVIGYLGPLSGSYAALGQVEKQGVELALQQYSATNPVVRVSVDPVDTGGDPSRLAAAVDALKRAHAVAVIGPALSSEAAAAGPLLTGAGIPTISPSASGVALAQQGWSDFHRVVADDSVLGRGAADELVRTLGDKTAAVVDDSSSSGAAVAGYVRTQLEADGGVDVFDGHVVPTARDDSGLVSQIVAVGPAALYFGGDASLAGRLLSELRAAGWTGTYLAGVRADAAQFMAVAGVSANGAYLSCGCADTSRGDNATLPFESAYQAAFGVPPAPFAAEAYDATNVMLDVIKAGAITPKAINNELAQSSWAGVTRTVKFWPDGNLEGGTTYISQVKAGTIVPVGTSG